MFDGVVRNLIYVRYLPQMKKNIISVGPVESKGLRVTFENGILEITKGSMVVMKSVRDKNLYYLKGSTVTGALAASVMLRPASQNTEYGYVMIANRYSRRVKSLP